MKCRDLFIGRGKSSWWFLTQHVFFFLLKGLVLQMHLERQLLKLNNCFASHLIRETELVIPHL